MVISNQRGAIIGPGTVGKLLKFATNTSAADSLISESGSTITVNGNLSAKQGDLPSSVRAAGVGGGVRFSPVSGYARSTTGYLNWTNDFSFEATFSVPVSIVNQGIVCLGGANGGNGANIVNVYMASGNLILVKRSAANVFQSVINISGFQTDYAGNVVSVCITKTSSLYSLYINGALAGTSTNYVSEEVAADYFHASFIATTYLDASVYSARLFNRALSAADVLALSLYGVNAADEWGTQTPLYTSDFSAGVDGWTALRSTITGNVDGIGSPSTDNVFRIVCDSTASHSHLATKTFSGITVGKRYRISGSAYISTSQTLVQGIFFGDAFNAFNYGVVLQSATWTPFSFEFVANASSQVAIYLRNNSAGGVFSGNGTDEAYVSGLTITPIGAIVDLDLATGAGGVLTDRSSNRLDATLYGAYTHITPVRKVAIESGTVTAWNPPLSVTQTWNNGATIFDGLSYTITDTASSASSRLANFLVGTARKLTIGKDGSLTTWGSYTDTSNYRQLLYSQTSGGAATIQSQGLGTGLTGNTLAIGTNGVTALSVSSTGVSIPVNLSATQGDLPSSVRAAGVGGGVQFGSTAGSRAESVMTGQAIGINDFTLAFRFKLPTANPSVAQYIGAIRDSSANQIVFNINVSGNIQTTFQKVGETQITITHTQASVAALGGQYIDITVVRSSVTSSFVYLNGLLLSTGTISGPAIGVSYSASTFFRTGDYLGSDVPYSAGPYTAARLFNRALSAADVLSLSLYGINAADEWGTMVPLYSSDFSAGVDTWSAARGTVAGNIDGISGVDNTLRFTIDGTGGLSHYAVVAKMTAGKRYKVSASVYVPAGQPGITNVKFTDGDGDTIGTVAAGAWGTISGECLTLANGNLIAYAQDSVNSTTFTGNSTDVFYIKDVVITPIGAIVDLDMATGGGTTLTDRSSNRLDATLYGAYTHITPSRRSVLESGTLTTSKPALNISQTWNDAGIGFEASSINITNTASAATSYFSVFRLSGATRFSVTKDGYLFAYQGLSTPYINFGNTGDTYLYKDAAGTLSQRNSTNAQTFLTHGTYTDASNYRRLRQTMTTGGASTIASEGLGTGLSGNTLVLSSNGTTAIDIGAAGVNIPVNLSATQGDLPSSVRAAGVGGGVQWNGAIGGYSKADLTASTPRTNSFTSHVRFRMPSAAWSASFVGIQSIASANTSANNGFTVYGHQGQDSIIFEFQGSSGSNYRRWNLPTGLRTLLSGQIVDLTIVRDTTPNVYAYINGVLQVLTTASIGVDPTAGHDINPTTPGLFTPFGSSTTLAEPIYTARLFNRALSAADVLALSLYGINAADEWGTMVPLYSSDFSAGLDGWSGIRASVTGNIDGIGSPSTDNTLQIVVDGTAANTHPASKTLSISTGKRYRISMSVLIPTANSIVDDIQFWNNSVSIAAITGKSDTWRTLSTEFVCGAQTSYVYPASSGSITFNGNSTDTIYIKDIVVTPLGALVDLDMATGSGTTLTDRSSNRLDATLYGSYNHTVATRKLAIDSGTLTANNPAISATQTWNNAGITFEGISLNVIPTASASNSRALVIKSSGVDKFIVYSGGGFYAPSDGTITGYLGLGGVGDLLIRREANGQMTLRNGVNPQSIRVFGTYTDASNYRSLDLTTTTGGATKLDSKGLGTGVAGNTLQLAVNSLAALDIAADGDTTLNYDLNAASGNVLTRIRTQAGTAPAMLPSSTGGSRVEAALTRTTIGTGDFTISGRIEIPSSNPTADIYLFELRDTTPTGRVIANLSSAGVLTVQSLKSGVLTAMTQLNLSAVSRYGGQVIDYAITRTGFTWSSYANGVLIGTLTDATHNSDFSSSAAFYYGGLSAISGAQGWKHRIYNTQLYTRALSASDCADLAQKGVNPADQWASGSALYTSDFSAGVDTFSSTQATIVGNIDAIGGRDDCLRFTVDSTAAVQHRIVRYNTIPIGKRVRVSFSVYIPSSNSTGVQVFPDNGYFNNTLGAAITTLDAWVDRTVEFVGNSNTSNAGGLFFYMRNSAGAYDFDGNGTDVFYVRGITVQQIGCALAWDFVGPGPTFADSSSNCYLGLGVGVSQTLPSSGGVYSYEARFLASAISTSAGTTKLIDLPFNAGVIDIEVVRHAAMDGGITLDVGTSGTAAKYASAIAMASTGLIYADSLSKGSESTTAVTPIYIKKSGSTTVGDISVRITIRARH